MIRLEYPNGKPLVGAEMPVLMFGSNENHCGAPVGIKVGMFKTDANGEIAFGATDSSLALNKGYWERENKGPAGTMFRFVPSLIVGNGRDITVRHLWKLPQYNYTIWLRDTRDGPIAHAHVTGCDNFDGCGVDCGALSGSPESDSLGVMRFRQQDLREMRSLTLVNAAGQKRSLTGPEMKELLTTHRLHLVW